MRAMQKYNPGTVVEWLHAEQDPITDIFTLCPQCQVQSHGLLETLSRVRRTMNYGLQRSTIFLSITYLKCTIIIVGIPKNTYAINHGVTWLNRQLQTSSFNRDNVIDRIMNFQLCHDYWYKMFNTKRVIWDRELHVLVVPDEIWWDWIETDPQTISYSHGQEELLWDKLPVLFPKRSHSRGSSGASTSGGSVG
ncbi:hypothetical protein ACS0TY_027775 [Phlomoides rotata]